jgi:chitinase
MLKPTLIQSKQFQLALILSLSVLLFISPPADCSGKVVAGYYPAWIQYTLPHSKIQYEDLTHIIHAFAWPTEEGEIEHYQDLLYPELIHSAHQNDVKVLISLGGYGNSDGFAAMVSDSLTRVRFIDNILYFCDRHGYDGIDFDWEWPSNATERNNLNRLIKELDAIMQEDESGLLLTMAVPTGNWNGQYYDMPFLKGYLNWFAGMTYDYFGSWITNAGHNSPLYPPSENNNGSVKSGMDYLRYTRGIPNEQILLGMPFYGRGCNATGYGKPNTGGNVEYGYKDIIPLIGNGWDYFWDNTAKVPYLLNENRTKFISFDDTASIRLKCEYAVERDFAGVMIWALGQDLVSDEEPLLKVAGSTVKNATSLDHRDFADILPENPVLLVNYPNPFNSVTNIKYSVVETHDHASLQSVELSIYDISGQKISTLVTGIQRAGKHMVVWDANNMATGTYFCTLTVDGIHIRTTKMLLLR